MDFKIKDKGKCALALDRALFPIHVNVFCKRIRPKHEAFTIRLEKLRVTISAEVANPLMSKCSGLRHKFLSIYQSKDSDAWFMQQVRWFFRCEELEDSQQDQIRADPEFSSTKGVMESMQVDNIEVESVLAVHIELTAQGDLLESATKHADGLPTIYLFCRHLQTEKAKIVNSIGTDTTRDWPRYQSHWRED
jgi:hypothetical protein